MNNTRLSKLLSVILAVAICATTVFGCLMTVNAATPLSYEIVADEVTNLTQASASITFNVPEGMSAGRFNLANTANDDFDSVTAVITGGKKIGGATATADDVANDFVTYEENGNQPFLINTDEVEDGDLAYVMFTLDEFTAENLYTSITFKFTFTFKGGEAVKGAEYDLAINGLEFVIGHAGNVTYEDETGELSGQPAKISTGCEHVVVVNENDLLKTDSVNGYAVYSKSSCSKCLEELGYQVVPTKVPAEQNVIYWSGEVADGIADDTSATDATKGTEENPIIINSAEELAYIATVKTDAANATTGKYYKIADGIDAIVLQPESDAAEAIMSLSTADQVKDYFENDDIINPVPWVSNSWQSASKVYPFAGNFDGNGVTIYGMFFSRTKESGPYTGLFSYVAGDPKVENVTIANAYLASAEHMGAVSSYLQTGNISGTYNKIAIENCAVINCYMESHANKYSKTAALLTGSMKVRELKNCIVYGNNARNVIVHNTVTNKIGFDLTLVADMTNETNNQDNFTNVVSLGTIPYSAYSYGYNALCSTTTPFTNVYTDVSIEKTLYKISDTNTDNVRLEVGSSKMSDTVIQSLTATNAAEVKTEAFVKTLNTNANATVFEAVNGGYPTFVKKVSKPGSSTAEHIEYYSGNNNFSANGGFITEAAEGVGSSAENPYIIDSVAELGYLVRYSTPAQTNGKFFKIADDIDALVLQTEDNLKKIGQNVKGVKTVEAGLEVIKNWTANEAKAYFDTNGGSSWAGSTGASTGAGVFEGTIDFNGVSIYGMYATAGLFQNVGAGVTFKNVTIKGAYVKGDTTAIIAASSYYGTQNGTMTFESCVVADCAITNTRKSVGSDRAGILFGNAYKTSTATSNRIAVNNCLVYGNKAKHQGFYDTITGYDITYGILGTAGGSNDNGWSSVTNSVILDTVPHGVKRDYGATANITYSNVYTNMIGAVITNIDNEVNASNVVTKTIEYKLSPTIDANGKYAFNIVETNLGTGASTSMTNTKPAGSILATDAKDIKGLGGGALVSDLNTANGATVWATTASGYPTPLSKYADTISAMSSLDLKLAAYNLTYNESGSFNLNYHYEPAYEGFAPELLIAKSDLSKFTALTPTESPYAGNGLSDDAIMYAIENISAREIEDTMLATLIVPNGDQAIWGKTEAISAKDYAIKVINGEAFYTKGGDAETIQKDKNVAASLINYGEAAKIALNTANDANKSTGETIYWDGTVATSIEDDTSATDATKGTESNPIIISNAKELAYLVSKEGAKSAGRYYKMADGISKIVLQPKDTAAADVLNLANAQAVRDHFESNPNGIKKWSQAATGSEFKGNFDGNLVTIYGMYSPSNNPGGLFSRCAGNVSLSNFTLRNSYLRTYNSGLVVGKNESNNTYYTRYENIAVINNCMIGYNDTNISAISNMSLLGVLTTKATINNLLVYDNIARFEGGKNIPNLTGPIGLINVNGWDQPWITNSIILDITPYRIPGDYTDTQGTESTDDDVVTTSTLAFAYATADARAFKNVYTDMPTTVTYKDKTVTYTESQIKQVNKADLQGSNVITTITNNETANNITNGFDWSKLAYGANGEYPTLVKAAESKRIEYWDGTEGGESVTYNDDGTIAINTLADNGEKGTSDDPIIIENAEELAFIANATGNVLNTDGTIKTETGKNYVTAGVYFKIADDIEAIVLQPKSDAANEIMSLTSAQEVKDHFEKYASSMKNWISSQYNTSTPFQGHLEGNGVTIYGLYHNKPSNTSYTGLIPVVGNDAIISNLTITNSYMVAGDNQGAITSYSRDGKATDTKNITFEGCAVTNCYMTNSKSDAGSVVRAGVLAGNINGNHNVVVNNCLVYGNYARNTAITLPDGSVGFDLSLVASLTNTNSTNNRITNSIVLGATPYVKYNYSFNGHNNATISNVYTDQEISGVKCYYTSLTATTTQTFSKMTKIDPADVIGSKAQTIVDAINAANGDSRDMYVGNAWGYPGFTEAGIMPTANQQAFDNLVLKNTDTYGAYNPEFSMYATSLNLKANPYIAFTFAFNGEYKANRDNISVTFTTASGKTTTTTVGNGNGGVSTGWTNNAGAGRYHLYRLKDIDVKDLAAGITVTVSYGGETYNFGTFSVEGFALDSANALKKNPTSNYYAANLNAAKALLYYVQTVSARYGA